MNKADVGVFNELDIEYLASVVITMSRTKEGDDFGVAIVSLVCSTCT